MSELFLYFTLCSFFGWILETLFRSFIINKKFSNAGFLYGPFVPIYGTVALCIYFISIILQDMFLPAALLIYFLIPSILEYVISFFLEKILNLKLWDYSNHKFNLSGRICLKFSIVWCFLVLVDVFAVQPFFIGKISMLPSGIKAALSYTFFIYFTIDLFFSLKLYRNFIKIKKTLDSLPELNEKFKSDNIFEEYPILFKIKNILKPLIAFPHLMVYVRKDMYNFIKKMQSYVNTKLRSKAEKIKDFKKDPEFVKLTKKIINHREYQKLKKFHHHEHSIYEHSLHIAWLSYKIGKQINKYVRINIPELTRGALLHDFFLYNWRTEKPASGKLHAFEHPKEAFKNSKTHFSPVTDIEKDIILKHMWPLGIVPPSYIETFIVLVVDKIIASKELFVEVVNTKKNKKESKMMKKNYGR